ncbi:DJ-1 family glyoxalase III [Faecalibacillus intestinalis]|uniref:DJ-1 family glyoxalase III n=1 Tax=Faecalibacillus intestinalis TaxID=1982626 RepID=UPI003995D7F2
MMQKTAIIIASGFEEGEALTIADIIKRAHLQCDLVGYEQEVKGGHEIIVRCDHILNETLLDYDMVILPGGYGGAEAMKNNPTLISYLQQMNEKGKYVCAMCAAPIVLEKANLLVDKKFTAYQGYDQKIKQRTYLNDKVVIDSNIVTSRGSATAYGFAYKLVELLGGDDLAVKKRMVYFNAFDVKEDE